MPAEPSELCRRFTEALASSAPTPGGGGAAALCGALAASLGSMAAAIRLGRCRDGEQAAAFSALLAPCQKLRENFLTLMDADARAFGELSPAYALPKDDPARPEAIRRLSLQAAQPPLAMLYAAVSTVDALEALLPHVGKLLLSDIACGASLAAAAMETAALNVFVNTAPLAKSCPEAAALQAEAEALLAGNLSRARALAGGILQELKGE